VRIGSLQFQPGELGKIAMIVFLAAYLHSKQEVARTGTTEGLRAAACDLGLRHARARGHTRFGSASFFFGIFLAILYLAPRGCSTLAVGLCLFLAGSCRGLTETTAHVRDRVTIWLHPWTTRQYRAPGTRF